jgi:hypothetical protein
MKKQIKPSLPAGRKLSLNKRTITNLKPNEMMQKIGAGPTNGKSCIYTCKHNCTPATLCCRNTFG